MDAPDAMLLDLLRRPSAQVYERAMRRYSRLMFRVARAMVGDDDLAEEVVVRAWLRAFAALPAFGGEISLEAWLVRIVIAECRDTARAQAEPGAAVPHR